MESFIQLNETPNHTRSIVINQVFGGFNLSDEARKIYTERTGLPAYDPPMDDPVLLEIVRTMGDRANGLFAKLAIIDIPLDVDWVIQDYDGSEWIAERHRTWGR